MNTPLRIGLIVVAAAVAVVLLIVLRPDEADSPDDAAATVPAETAPTDTETPQETTDEGETDEADTQETTQEEPDVVRARLVIGSDGPSGVQRIRARQGQRVILTVRSQIQDHVHVHGYDLFADVGPEQQARIQFRADLPGRFEIELEDRHTLIAQLRVDP